MADNTPGWDRDLTGAYIRVYVAEILTGPKIITVGDREVLSVTATVSSVEVDERLRPVLRVALHDDAGSDDVMVSPYNVELLGDE